MQAPDDFIWTALIHAVEANDATAISAMAAAGGDVFQATICSNGPDDEDERTPLMLAYWLGKTEAAIALVNAGSDFLQEDARGRSASWYARRSGRGQQVRAMSNIIRTESAKAAMKKVIDGAAQPDLAPPKKRRTDV